MALLVFDRILPKALGVGSPSAVSIALPRALGFDFCFGFGAGCSFFFEGGEESNGHVGVGNLVFDGGRCGVHAVLADGGEDFACDPALEGFGFRLAGHEDDFV